MMYLLFISTVLPPQIVHLAVVLPFVRL